MMMLEQKTTEFLDVLSSSAPVPGGGGASAAVGAFASALGMMVTNLTIGKKKYIDVEAEMEDIRSRLEALQQELVGLTDRDAEAFEPLSRAYGLPKETEEPEDRERKSDGKSALRSKRCAASDYEDRVPGDGRSGSAWRERKPPCGQ